ncbi:Tymo-45kd-70kd domain containing protein [Pyrenophora tritici-repentis]|nr:Tymo-45kd-70kd domain containing protein [Pyrenophora tritici-repentis]
MASRLLRINRSVFLAARQASTPITASSRPTPFKQSLFNVNDLSNHSTRPFSISAVAMNIQVDPAFISQITAAEKLITGTDEPVKGGPTAKAQQHVGQILTSQVVHDITEGEKLITGTDEPFKGGPTAVAQSALTNSGSTNNNNATRNASSGNNTNSNSNNHSGTFDSETLSKINEAEKKLTGEAQPVRGGPTAQAQSHAKEPITSQALHDITEGEKMVTGGERVKGGPTSTAQSELGKSRS